MIPTHWRGAPEGRQDSKGDSLLQDGDCRGVVCNTVSLLLCQLSILGAATWQMTTLQFRLDTFKARYVYLCIEEAGAWNKAMPDQVCFDNMDSADQACFDDVNNGQTKPALTPWMMQKPDGCLAVMLQHMLDIHRICTYQQTQLSHSSIFICRGAVPKTGVLGAAWYHLVIYT